MVEGLLINGVVVGLRHARQRAEASTREARSHQERLRQSEERYRVVAETASDAIFMIDADSQILFANSAAEKIFGYAGDEMLGEPLTMLMPEHLRGVHRASLKRYVDTGRRHLTSWEAIQLPGLHKSGREIPLEISFGEFTREGERFFTGFVRDITERKRHEEALTFLAEAGTELAASLDYRETLASVARLAVVHLADWGVVDVVEGDGSLSRLAVAHQDPRKVELAQRLQERYPQDPDSPQGVPNVLRTGRPELYSEVTQEMLEAAARDEEHLRILCDLGCTSAMCVPLLVRGRVMGVITLAAAESGRRYGEADLKLAEDLARRAALAVDNAWLYDEAQKELTERQRAEETLRRSEERYRAVVEQAAEGICLIDAEDKHILEANRKFQRMLGYTSEEVAELSLYDFIAHDRESVDRNFQLTLQKGSHTAGERRYRRKDGSLVDVMASGSAISYGGRRVASLVIRDITERKRYEEALRASNERFRLLVEGVKDYAIFMLDPDGCIVSWNEGAERISGYRAEEIIGEHISCLYTEEDVESGQLEEELRLAQAEGRYEEESLRVHKDGSRFWASVTLTALRDEDGNVRGFSKVTRDISERKQAQERLQDTLDSLLALYEAGQILGSTLESEEVVSSLLQIMQRVSHLTAALISVQDDDGSMHIWRSVGLEGLWPRARYAPEAADARQAALETEEPQLFLLQRPGLGTELGTERLVGLCLPLLIRDRSLGVLEAYGTEALAESDAVELLGSLASQAASALENARLYGELADREHRLQDLVEKLLVAQEEERRHVAYEVHDGLAQVAVAAHTYLNAFARQHAHHDLRGREKLDRALELIEKTVEEARHVIADLRPTALDDFGLATALRLYVEKLHSDDCNVSYEETLGDVRLPVSVETTLFRVAQEALTNVRKHAASPRVHIKLERMDETIRLEVHDWGQGFELSKGTSDGGPGERVGLAGMQERITLLGGDFEIHSELGAGTSIVAEVPLPEENTDNDR
jgi:PAS domain S-box-containing protein